MSLVGMYFHATEDGFLMHQGQVIARANQDSYLCMLFSWNDESETFAKLFRVDEMRSWRFYRCKETMWMAYEREMNKTTPEQ